MPTIRFPTDGPQYLTMRQRGALDNTPFEVVDSNGGLRQPRGMSTLADLDNWMIEHGYTVTNQRPDFRGRRGRLHHVIADVVPKGQTLNEH